jgi:hypothetical protein
MKISLDDLEKVELTGTTSLAAGEEIDPEDSLTAIIRVSEPDYVPKEVKVRARIDPTLITASFLGKSLKALQSDPRVQSVSLSRRLQNMERQQ